MGRHIFVKGDPCTECGGDRFYKVSGKCKLCVDVKRRENMRRHSPGSRCWETVRHEGEQVKAIMHGVNYQREFHASR